MSEYYNNVSIDIFLKDLIQMESVQDILKTEFGTEEAEIILMNFKKGISNIEIEDKLVNMLSDFVKNNAVEVDTLIGMGGYGEFPISIMNFGPLYWVDAQEFDSIEYFSSKEDAISCAEFEYAEYL